MTGGRSYKRSPYNRATQARRLIDRTARVQFAGSFERQLLPEGVLCTITLPIEIEVQNTPELT